MTKAASEKMVARHSLDPLRKPFDLYRYSPIDKGASEIRLMTLVPGAFGSKLRITIRNDALSPSLRPEYEALSYTWGLANDIDHIYVQEDGGDKALAITKNLVEALRYLRYGDRSRVLWIDAICVDQNNIAERGHQVLRMADIYRRASRVIIWLGPERDDSTLALQELNALGTSIEIDWAALGVRPLSDESFDQWIEEPLSFGKDRRIVAAIESLLDRSWFKRLWIWQEVQLAEAGAVIICGGECMLWHTFRNAILSLHYKKCSFLLSQQLINLCAYHQLQPRLRDLLHYTRHAKFSDERDRVYAILNLTCDFFEFEPDYSKTTKDVFKSVVLTYASRKDLTVLSQCEMREDRETDFPSWVPDWTKPYESNRLYGMRASSVTAAQARCDKGDVLVVSGCLIDTLDVIEQISHLTSGSSTEQMRKIVRIMIGSKAGNDTCAASDAIIDSVCRTLCGNLFAESYLPLVLSLPNTRESQKYVRGLIDTHKYIHQVYGYTKGRASFATRNGHIGLGPQSIRAGDQACIVLGCNSLLILRSNDAQTFEVVGECYIDGFMEGEALLSALPRNWQRISRYFPDLDRDYDAFMNVQTGVVQVEDPRLGPLPAGWSIADHRKKHVYNKFSNEELGVTATLTDPRLSPEALIARGVNLQEIRLV